MREKRHPARFARLRMGEATALCRWHLAKYPLSGAEDEP
jgi:hypothetical protein